MWVQEAITLRSETWSEERCQNSAQERSEKKNQEKVERYLWTLKMTRIRSVGSSAPITGVGTGYSNDPVTSIFEKV